MRQQPLHQVIGGDNGPDDYNRKGLAEMGREVQEGGRDNVQPVLNVLRALGRAVSLNIVGKNEIRPGRSLFQAARPAGDSAGNDDCPAGLAPLAKRSQDVPEDDPIAKPTATRQGSVLCLVLTLGLLLQCRNG